MILRTGEWELARMDVYNMGTQLPDRCAASIKANKLLQAIATERAFRRDQMQMPLCAGCAGRGLLC